MELRGIVTPSGFKLNLINMRKEKISILFSVKVRLCSGERGTKIKPGFQEGIVMAQNSSNAEKAACKIITENLRRQYPTAYAEPFRTVKLKQDFIFDDKDL